MKLTYATAAWFLLIATWMPMTMAAPAVAKGSKKTKPSGPSRFSLPSPLPDADTGAENSHIEQNGPLPKNVTTKYGMAMNATSGPKVSHAPLTLAAGSQSAVSVESLEFYTSLAAATYCGDVQSNKWTCKQCKKVPDGKLILSFDTPKYDTVGYILQSDSKKAIYIAFRGINVCCYLYVGVHLLISTSVGTNSIESTIADIKFVLTPYPPISGAKIHLGFLQSFQESKDIIFSHATQLMNAHPDYTFYVVGCVVIEHSLGGAIAVLEALDLYQRDVRFTPNNLQVYTFGEPRVGNPTFAYYASGTGIQVKRVVHERDSALIFCSISVVPHLPPELLGYLHEGSEYWITDDRYDIGKHKIRALDANCIFLTLCASLHLAVCNGALDSGSCSNSIVPFTSIVDHLRYLCF
ncbi:hypothetical protein INT44_004777 [Umbelopsis vinacea]|uniref:Fungal lipase-type domain-containing protein n=1 Tax=Umbelopsis vinacea TaxID=44442 RepID=A0A8H7Q6T9_9FUNG|nr:hypothetical protein INT44_004777 [Umbelopsis vinacea]